MKYRKHAILLAISATLLASPSISQAQLGGDPTTPPSGVPTRTMKTLDQVEARIPLVDGAPGVILEANGGFTITAGGSYYLVENLVVDSGDAIKLNNNGITLDLNGFSIASTAPVFAGSAIVINAPQIVITNGHIVSGATYDSEASENPFSGTGFINGIISNADTHSSARVKDISVRGVSGAGISIFDLEENPGTGPNRGMNSFVENCQVEICGGVGIAAGVVKNSSVFRAGGIGIWAIQVHYCIAESVGSNGIVANLGIVSYSTGLSPLNSSGIVANIAVGSSDGGSGSGIDPISNRYLMP